MVEDKLTDQEQRSLLQLARKTISEVLSRGQASQENTINERFLVKRGIFVSLHQGEILRGCIGTFSTGQPLYETVREMAVSAALHDPRFPSLRKEELSGIDIEISVLTPLKQIKDVSSIEVGRHGIFISRRGASGVLLPQVATEQGWDRETFLTHTCQKAGLDPDAWKDPETKIEIFEAEIFGEKTDC